MKTTLQNDIQVFESMVGSSDAWLKFIKFWSLVMHECKRKEDIVRVFSLVTIYIPRQEYILGSSASIQGGNWNITDNLPILYAK